MKEYRKRLLSLLENEKQTHSNTVDTYDGNNISVEQFGEHCEAITFIDQFIHIVKQAN